MTPVFIPTREIKVVIADIDRDGENVAIVHRTGTIFWHKEEKIPEVRFRPPKYVDITIPQMEAILEAMKKFKSDEDPRPNPTSSR